MTTNLPTARAFLVSEGLAKDGRGKFSNAAKERLKEAAANGQQFSDWPKEEIVITHTATGKKKKTVTVKAVPKDTVSYETPPEIWSDDVKFVGENSGKETGYREVCSNCHKSLRWCYCPHPYALVGIKSEPLIRKSRTTGREVFSPMALTSANG